MINWSLVGFNALWILGLGLEVATLSFANSLANYRKIKYRQALKIHPAFDDALVKLKKAVAINPDLGKAYLMIGTCYLDKEDYQRALEFFTKALSVSLG
jgi:tetratricopeptide (TPR) repeat protein